STTAPSSKTSSRKSSQRSTRSFAIPRSNLTPSAPASATSTSRASPSLGSADRGWQRQLVVGVRSTRGINSRVLHTSTQASSKARPDPSCTGGALTIVRATQHSAIILITSRPSHSDEAPMNLRLLFAFACLLFITPTLTADPPEGLRYLRPSEAIEDKDDQSFW